MRGVFEPARSDHGGGRLVRSQHLDLKDVVMFPDVTDLEGLVSGT
jgi:hypothetical protein